MFVYFNHITLRDLEGDVIAFLRVCPVQPQLGALAPLSLMTLPVLEYCSVFHCCACSAAPSKGTLSSTVWSNHNGQNEQSMQRLERILKDLNSLG